MSVYDYPYEIGRVAASDSSSEAPDQPRYACTECPDEVVLDDLAYLGGSTDERGRAAIVKPKLGSKAVDVGVCVRCYNARRGGALPPLHVSV